MANGEQVEQISREVITIPDQAKLILVKDAESMARGNEFFLVIKGLRKKIADTMNPIIEAAHKTHKVALGQKADLEAPLILAETWLNGQMTRYKREQDELRRAEEEKLRLAAIQVEMERRKAEDARRMEEAAALEQAGAKEEAEQVMAEIIQENETPIIVTPPPPSIPRVETKGMATQTNWKFEIIDESLIPRQFLIPDMVKIGGIVRSLKGETKIPGIRPYPESKMKATGR